MTKQEIISTLSKFFSFDFFVTELKKYAHFGGRTKRKEFFLFVLTSFFIFVGLQRMSIDLSYPTLLTVYEVFIFPPLIAAIVRRLHDTGKSGFTFPLYFAISVLLFWGGAFLIHQNLSLLNYWGLFCLLIACYPFFLLFKKSDPEINKYDSMPSHPIRHGTLLILFILFILFITTALNNLMQNLPVLEVEEELSVEEINQIDKIINDFKNKQ